MLKSTTVTHASVLISIGAHLKSVTNAGLVLYNKLSNNIKLCNCDLLKRNLHVFMVKSCLHYVKDYLSRKYKHFLKCKFSKG